MTRLEELKQKIYEVLFAGRKRRTITPPPAERSDLPRSWQQLPEEVVKAEYHQKTSKIWIVFGVFFVIMALAFLGYVGIRSGFLFYFLGESEVELAILSPDSVVAGDLVTYSVTYKNKSASTLQNIQLEFQYPKGSEPIDESDETLALTSLRVSTILPNLLPGTEGHLDFRARIFGKENDSESASAKLTYQPGNIASKFSAIAGKDITIMRVPIVLTAEPPAKVRSGDAYDFDLQYTSNANAPFKHVAVRVIYPDGFQFQNSSIPPVAKNNQEMIWALGDVSPGVSGSIHVSGIIGGALLEPKTLQYGLGTYVKDTGEWTPYVERTAVAEIVASPLSIEATVNNSRDVNASFGDTLQVMLKIKNSSSGPIKNLSIGTHLDGPIDVFSISVFGGAVSGSQDIRWTPATDKTLLQLDAGAEKTISFSMRLKQKEKVGLVKNPTVSIASSVNGQGEDTLNLLSSDTLLVPINAAPLFAARALYTGSVIKNLGPVPPKVGQRTTYTIVWEAQAFGNDLKDVTIKAKVPPYVQWENTVVPNSEKIAYQQSTGEIIWNPGVISASSFSAEPKRVYFKISFVPTANQANSFIPLLQGIIGDATDVFTNKQLEVTLQDVTTNLVDDFGVPQNSGQVQP